MDGEVKSKACPEFESALEEYVEGELESTQIGRVSDHLQSCAACQSAFELASASCLLLRATREPAEQVDVWFVRRTMIAIGAEENRLAEEKSFWKPMEALAWRFAMSAGVAVIVLLAYGRMAHVSMPGDAGARPAQVRDIFQDPMRPPSDREEVLLMVAEANHDK
ncbi:MAG: zf-HC2 domain-containing protein [Candidatus Acidiferrales bacterium]